MSGSKRKVAILCGGRSGEHEISLRSARSIVDAIDRERFEPVMVGIDHDGGWHRLDEAAFTAITNASLPSLTDDGEPVAMTPAPMTTLPRRSASGAGSGLADIDVILPVLHGTFGEDGCVQGLLELADVPYVGSGVLGSAIGMDKDVQKRLLQAAGIPVVPFITTTRARLASDSDGEAARMRALGLPLFVKPANLGSSVGVSKVHEWSELPHALEVAARFDLKLLVEHGIDAREIECAVLGNDEPQASIPGEVCANADFYSYEAKYIDEKGATLLIPAPLSEAQTREVRELAVRVFRELDCAGMARVDLFLERGSDRFYVNEINTLPGFTNISMYPKLWEASGLPYRDLITRLIELAQERHTQRQSLQRSFTPETR